MPVLDRVEGLIVLSEQKIKESPVSHGATSLRAKNLLDHKISVSNSMKALVTSIGLLRITVSAAAQGQILFDNFVSGEVDVFFNGALIPARAIGEGISNPGAGGVWHVALLWNASTVGSGVPQNAFTEVADYIPTFGANPIEGDGSFGDTSGGKEVAITVPGVGLATFEVVS